MKKKYRLYVKQKPSYETIDKYTYYDLDQFIHDYEFGDLQKYNADDYVVEIRSYSVDSE